ncbi:MAG: hypothetical protein WD431_00370 [Cyclobacteriaceae bacterium]
MNRYSKIGLVNMAILGLGFFLILGCEGPIGPIGPPGQDGTDGVNIVGEVFDIEGDFMEAGEYGLLGEYGFEILDSDKVLVYRLEFVDQDNFVVWKPLPKTVFHNNGIFTYSYDFTTIDFSIYLEGNFNLNSLEPIWTDDQVFRVLIIPADFINGRMDLSDQDALLKKMGVDQGKIPRIFLN